MPCSSSSPLEELKMEGSLMVSSIYNEYQTKAAVTAIYPGRLGYVRGTDLRGVYYTAMGLAGESAELLEKFMATTIVNDDDIIKEMGDVLWYQSQCSMELATHFGYIKEISMNDHIKDYAKNTLSGCFLCCVSAGKYCDTVKKCLRDNHGCISNSIRKILLDCLAFSLLSIEQLCFGRNYDIKNIMDINIKKLALRASNGTLGGNGDNR